MTSENACVTVNHFMKSPLVSWAKTFQDEEKKILEFNRLCDGVFLYNIWLEIDPHPPYHGINLSTNDLTTRIRNLDVLVHNIRAFYEEVLGQLLLVKIPDILTLARSTEEHTSVSEMESLLLLILGCAVQCERKEHFIEVIKSMDLDIQHKIVDYIQQITDNPKAIWTTEWSELNLVPAEDHEHMFNLLVQHLRRLVRERDDLMQKVISAAMQNINLSSANHPPSPLSISCVDKSHLVVELADVKARLRKLQQEVEEKNEGITELKEELELSKDAHSKLRQENLELVQDARTAKTYRDEIDILKERVRKVDRLESEIQRYKDKMNELEFYKSRVEELREDNRILMETKTMLEEQLEVSRKRAEQVIDLEADILKYCSQINELTIEREADRDKIQQLLEENAQLHIERKASTEELGQLQSELSQTLRHYSPVENHSLLDQLNTDAQTRVFQLELENQRLRILVDSLNRSPSFEVMDMENLPDMQKYMSNLDHNFLMDSGNGNVENRTMILKDYSLLKEKMIFLEKEAEDLKLALKRTAPLEIHCQELEKLVEELRCNLNTQKVDLVKCDQLEHSLSSLSSENQKLQKIVDSGHEKMKELQQDLQSFEIENQKLNNNLDSLKLSLHKYHDLEKESTNLEALNHKLEVEMKGLEKENRRLKISLETRDGTIERNSSRISCLERESKVLVKDVDNLQQVAAKVWELERENKELCQQTAVDKKSLEALRQDLVLEKIANQKLNSELHNIKAMRENNVSSPQIMTYDHDNQINELRAADKFLTEAEPKKCPELADFNTNNERREKKKLGKSIEDVSEKQDVAAEKQPEKLFENETTLSDLLEEVNKLKVEVQDLEKRNTAVEEDNCNLSNQTSSMRDQNANLKSQLDALQQNLSTVLLQNSGLQSRLAKLEVEITLTTSQNQALNSQNSLLQSQLSSLEEGSKKNNSQYEDAYSRNQSLLNDHESLERLHEQLANDYDSLVKNHSSLKSMHKSLKVEHNALKVEQLHATLFSQEEVIRLREVLEEDTSRTENRFPTNLRNEHLQLKDQLKSLKETHDEVTKELKSLQTMHRSLKKENNDMKLKYTAMQGDLMECQNEMSSLDVEVSKLSNCCELLSQKNTLLEEEQQSLMNHVSRLLGQYHELLNQVVSEQGKHRKDESGFHMRLWELCQQKEKLEQKINDHCHRMQKSPKRKNSPLTGSLRMRRTRSAFIRNAKHNDSLNLHSDNSTDSSLYCSFRRPKKQTAWANLTRSMTNAEDSCQEDHIPVRDVGLDILQDGNQADTISVIPPEQKEEKPLLESGNPATPQHTTLENNMTLNLITNLTNSSGNPQGLAPLSHLPSSGPRLDYAFRPLPSSQGTKNSSQGFESISRGLLTDSSSNPESVESSRYSKTRQNDKGDKELSVTHNNAINNKEKGPENSIWYEYGCV